MDTVHSRVRWWPLLIITILAILGIGIVWGFNAEARESKGLLTITILILTLFLGTVWLLFLSGLAWRLRLFGLLIILGGIALFGIIFRISGVRGDLMPVVEWRWAKKASNAVSVSRGQGIIPTTQSRIPTTDYPQFLGPNRNAVLPDIRIERDWETHPPKLVWRRPIGAGWAAFAVVGNSAITQEQDGDWEKVVCYELTTGEVKWSHRDKARYDSALAGLGPRATPTITGDKVYTVGSTGIFNCLNFETGEQLWTTNIFEQNDAELPPWGVSISPLIYEELAIVSAGGAVAYHKDTGDIVWRGHRTGTGYSSPLLTTLAGTPQIVIFNQGLVTSHEPATGELFWKQSWPKVECVSQPLPLSDNTLFVSTAYGIGTKRFQIERNPNGGFNVSLLWETIHLKAKFTTVFYHEGYLYGLDDGIFACINSADGKRQWKQGRYGHGQALLVKDVLLLLTESGELVLIEPNPTGLIELARHQVLAGRTWNTPALAGSYLLVRNGREAACYQLPIVDTSINGNQ